MGCQYWVAQGEASIARRISRHLPSASHFTARRALSIADRSRRLAHNAFDARPLLMPNFRRQFPLAHRYRHAALINEFHAAA